MTIKITIKNEHPNAEYGFGVQVSETANGVSVLKSGESKEVTLHSGNQVEIAEVALEEKVEAEKTDTDAAASAGTPAEEKTEAKDSE